jgi:hypothetical protein
LSETGGRTFYEAVELVGLLLFHFDAKFVEDVSGSEIQFRIGVTRNLLRFEPQGQSGRMTKQRKQLVLNSPVEKARSLLVGKRLSLIKEERIAFRGHRADPGGVK